LYFVVFLSANRAAPKNDIESEIKTTNLFKDLWNNKLASSLKHEIPRKLCPLFGGEIVKALWCCLGTAITAGVI
jgi:hypothetical protein